MITTITTPNLAADLISIDIAVAAIIAATPDSFDTYICPAVSLKPTSSCDDYVLTDHTDYQLLGAVDVNDVTITVTFGLMDDCYCDFGCPESPETNFIISYPDLKRDGLYCATVEFTYVLGEEIFTKTLKVAYNKDCCTKKFDDISFSVWGKMSQISCTMMSYSKIGKKVNKLRDSYLKLSNMLWLYYNHVDACNDWEKVSCMYNKIK